jgi:hypothetical protein
VAVEAAGGEDGADVIVEGDAVLRGGGAGERGEEDGEEGMCGVVWHG